MAQMDSATLAILAKRGCQAILSRGTDFLSELKLDISFETAYFDAADHLPVTVLKVVTDKAAQDAHGEMSSGALCVIFDHLSTFSSFADPGWWEVPNGNTDEASLAEHVADRIALELGLSRNIKLHVQRPVPAGSTVYLVTKILENTPRATYFFSQLFDTDGILLATGHHDKVKLHKVVKAKI